MTEDRKDDDEAKLEELAKRLLNTPPKPKSKSGKPSETEKDNPISSPPRDQGEGRILTAS